MAYFRHGDPLDDFQELDSRQSEERLPVCEDKRCGKVINEDYYFEIDGFIFCEDCMNRRCRRNTNDF